MEYPLYYTQKWDYLHIPIFSKRHIFDKTTGTYSLKVKGREKDDGKYICMYSHMHNEVEMIYIIRGSMYIETRSGLSIAHEGDTLMFNSYEPHMSYIDDENPTVEYCYFTANLSQLVPPIKYGITGKFNELVFSERVNDQAVGEMINRLPEYCKRMGNNGSTELAMLSILYGIIARLGDLGCIQDHGTDHSAPSFEALVTDFIEEHYNENITAEMLQNHFKYSRSYFCRLFKKHFNKSFSKFMDEFRIRKAVTIMKSNHNISISQIASSVGFPNSSVFAYKFRKFYGMTPSEYKNYLQY